MNSIIRNGAFKIHRHLRQQSVLRAIIGVRRDTLDTLHCDCQSCFPRTHARWLSTSTHLSNSHGKPLYGVSSQSPDKSDAEQPGEQQPGKQQPRPSSTSSVDEAEVEKFSRISAAWWDESGEFAALHSMNELRVPLIRDTLLEIKCSEAQDWDAQYSTTPLRGLHILDVGCGGGILSEPLARVGADVTGIDASADNIQMATHHANIDPRLAGRLKYQCCAVEDLSTNEAGVYDAVVASEILEHVNHQQEFINSCCRLVKPGGSIFVTTLNRTLISYGLGIIAAEQVFQIVPKGSHDWNKFVNPETLQSWLSEAGFRTALLHGMRMNPASKRWIWSRNTSINYAIHATRIN